MDIIKAGGGMLRISSGMAAGTPAIMLEVFAKAGKVDTSKGKIAISTEMLGSVLIAMADAANRATADAEGKAKPTGWAVVNADIVEAMQGRGKRERTDG
jgi:hypothetical protein